MKTKFVLQCYSLLCVDFYCFRICFSAVVTQKFGLGLGLTNLVLLTSLTLACKCNVL